MRLYAVVQCSKAICLFQALLAQKINAYSPHMGLLNGFAKKRLAGLCDTEDYVIRITRCLQIHFNF